jgi:HSP20 family protein
MSIIPWKNKRREDGGQEGGTSLATLRTEVDRLFNTFLRDPLSAFDWPLAGQREWLPAVDVSESDKEVTIRAEVPGIDPKDIEVSVSGNQLTLSGEKKETSEREGRDFHRVESHYGMFHRVVELPGNVDAEHVEAEYANGVLTVKLNKTQATQPKRIEVKTK